ncbi:MAG TPA: alpha/beta family hydrolase [Pyrinomonadaceae bacterium]|nr:alpha/beta family hydrolase [Pyrinomonadaceae bacterium]
MEPEPLKIDIRKDETVTALLYPASRKDRAGWTIILGHGAGANQLSPFMRLFASGFAERGLDAVTFNFLYKERGRSVPDQKTKLEACFAAVISQVRTHKKLKKNQLAIGGKSMGGRIASQVAAALSSGAYQDAGLPIDNRSINALVFLGYPLHPPGKPEQLRDAHLKDVEAPMLFVQGTRDPFGSPEEIRAVIKKHRLPGTIHLIEGGDHSFKVPKSVAPQNEVFEFVLDKIRTWLTTIGD